MASAEVSDLTDALRVSSRAALKRKAELVAKEKRYRILIQKRVKIVTWRRSGSCS
jgi:hypothetical protein